MALTKAEKAELIAFCQHIAREYDLGGIRTTEELITITLSFLAELLGVPDEVMAERLGTDPRGTLAKLGTAVEKRKKASGRLNRGTAGYGSGTGTGTAQNVVSFPSSKEALIDRLILRGLSNDAIYREVGGKRSVTLELIRRRREQLKLRRPTGLGLSQRAGNGG